jgi:hypothetical protein
MTDLAAAVALLVLQARLEARDPQEAARTTRSPSRSSTS